MLATYENCGKFTKAFAIILISYHELSVCHYKITISHGEQWKMVELCKLKHTYHVLQTEGTAHLYSDVHANSPAINLMKIYSSGDDRTANASVFTNLLSPFFRRAAVL